MLCSSKDGDSGLLYLSAERKTLNLMKESVSDKHSGSVKEQEGLNTFVTITFVESFLVTRVLFTHIPAAFLVSTFILR